MEKHRCRICTKSFPCGRSLGGHMRSHIKLENPKKICRPSDLAGEDPTSSSFSGKKHCKECGKNFPSLKALFGHMRLHSEKSTLQRSQEMDQKMEEKEEEEEEGSWSCHRFFQESTSGDNAPAAESRSNRRQNPAEVAIQSPSITAYDEHEEVAISLMMLSRDISGCWVPATESSNNPSLKLKKGDEIKLQSEFGDFEDAGDSDDEPRTPNFAEFGEKRPRVDKVKPQSELGDFDCECLEAAGDSDNQPRNLNLVEFVEKGPRIEKKRNCLIPRSSKLKRPNPNLEHMYQCASCGRIFPTYQALGGHRASHKRIKSCCTQKPNAKSEFKCKQLGMEIEEVSNNFQSNSSRIHKCSICAKCFSSGQALGGHKRSHVVPNVDCVMEVTAETKVTELLDLNFPAPGDEESSNVKSWRSCESVGNEQVMVDFINI